MRRLLSSVGLSAHAPSSGISLLFYFFIPVLNAAQYQHRLDANWRGGVLYLGAHPFNGLLWW